MHRDSRKYLCKECGEFAVKPLRKGVSICLKCGYSPKYVDWKFYEDAAGDLIDEKKDRELSDVETTLLEVMRVLKDVDSLYDKLPEKDKFPDKKRSVVMYYFKHREELL